MLAIGCARLLAADGRVDVHIAAAGGNGGGSAAPNKDFRIVGSVRELVPGIRRSLPLTVSNDNNFEVQLSKLDVKASDGNASCGAGWLSITPFVGPVAVPANGSTTVTLQVGLGSSAPDACKRATFALVYSGTAVKK
jgi:hypothetical protein